MWIEDVNDISKTENKHLGLSMKTRGYSPRIVSLCDNLNLKCLEFWKDIYYYFFGKEYDTNSIQSHLNYTVSELRHEKKNVNREKLDVHLREQCLHFAKT